VYAIIRLVDIHDVFRGMGIVKNLDLQLTLFLNTLSSMEHNTTQAGLAVGIGANSFAPVQFNLEALDTANLSNGQIGVRFTNLVLTGASGTNSELWMERISLSADQEATLLSQPNRKIRFRDFSLYEQGAVAINTSNAINISIPSVESPKRLFILYFKDGVNNATGTYHPGQSMSDPAPYYSHPGYGSSNMQVKVNTVQMWESPATQDYVDFHRNARVNFGGIDGNQTPELCSGQWSYFAWDKSKLTVVDLSNRVPPNTTVSLQITATSVNPYLMRVMVFVEHWLEIDCLESGNATTFGVQRYV
jgi:hypothetical protein